MSRRYLTSAALGELEATLTRRDLKVLHYVASLRFVSGAQLTRLCFDGMGDASAKARAARRALLRLSRLDVLARLPRRVGGVRAGSAGSVYYLGLAGQRLAMARDLLPGAPRRRSRLPGTLFVRHTLLVAELHTRLIEADRTQRFELLELTAEPSCHRRYDGYGSQPLVLKPDSYVRLAAEDYEYRYFIEIDRGTEGSRAIERQLAAYLAYYQSGREQAAHGVFPLVLWLTTSRRRGPAIRASVERLPVEAAELFAVQQFDDALPLMLALV